MTRLRLQMACLLAGLTLGVESPTAQTSAPPGASSGPGAPSTVPALRPFQLFSIDPSFDRLLAPDVQLETITTFPQLRGEGLLWRDGKLRLSEMRTGQIIEISLDGTRRIVVENVGGLMSEDVPTLQGSNGQANWHEGAVLLCRHGARDIAIMHRDGTIESFIADFNGKRFNSPNDIAIGKDGSVWFTDPPLALPGHPWARAADPNAPPSSLIRPMDKQIPFNGVFRFKHGELTSAVTDMPAPNGLAFSPDGKTLYINNTQPEMYVRAYAVADDGTLSDERELIRIPPDNGYGTGVPDGLKIDRKGNLWMTGPGGILVISRAGKLLGRIQLPSRATNLTFGDDYRSLFIISNPSIYRIRTRVRGLAPFANRER